MIEIKNGVILRGVIDSKINDILGSVLIVDSRLVIEIMQNL